MGGGDHGWTGQEREQRGAEKEAGKDQERRLSVAATGWVKGTGHANTSGTVTMTLLSLLPATHMPSELKFQAPGLLGFNLGASLRSIV